MSKSFDKLWREVVKRSSGFPVVQEYHELEHVFNLMQGCRSYLEVGTAEGNSLYVLSHALKQPRAAIGIIDYGEEHTKKARQEILEWIRSDLRPRWIREKYGNSHDPSLFIDIAECEEGVLGYDVVLIDAGHAYEDVIADAIAYGSLATKYIFFHDVCLPEVGRAFDWYCKQRPDCRAYKMINSETFGYGIMEITQ